MISAVRPEIPHPNRFSINKVTTTPSEMSARNLAKPFAIAGFILAEIYMLFTVLAPYGHEKHELPFQIPDVSALPPGAPVPLRATIIRVAVCSIFFGPFGAVIGTGIGLLVSGLLGDFSQKPPSAPKKDHPPD
jgi:hypothetical protein